MKKYLVIIALAYLIGFYTGEGGLPKGLELRNAMVVCLVSGFYAGTRYAKLQRSKKPFTLFGYEVVVRKPGKAAEPVQPEIKLVKTKTPQPSCELCEGETEIRIKGTKDVIPCPKCSNSKAQAKV